MNRAKKERFGEATVITAGDPEPQKRLFVGVPTLGSVRYEWVLSRYGQVIPCNWSQNDHVQWMNPYGPIRFQVADARNIIVAEFIRGGFNWLMFIDDDVMLPPLWLVGINDYLIKEDPPVFSGLYFTKSVPSEPLVYRGRGNGYYAKWKVGDRVWVDGIPMGCTLIHSSILRVLWEESEEYVIQGQRIRRVFETPVRVFYDPETRSFNTQTGTEDLEFCSRVMKNDIFMKAGWSKYANKDYPFLIDTKYFCWHINSQGVRFPSQGEQGKFIRRRTKARKK